METVAASYIFCLVFDVYKRAKKNRKNVLPSSFPVSISLFLLRKEDYLLSVITNRAKTELLSCVSWLWLCSRA